MDMFLLGIAIGILITLALRWSARIEARNAEAEDTRAMKKCKEADERSLKESVERVKQQWVDVSKPNEDETLDAFEQWYAEYFSQVEE